MFGQLVVGSPGSGKTTYCAGMYQFLSAAGRKSAIINLDPSNESSFCEPTIDIIDLITLDAVQNEFDLGPNGGMLYCFDYLAENVDWLLKKIEILLEECKYFLIDCPGQVELFTTNGSLLVVINKLIEKFHIRLATVNLVDCSLCVDPSKFISVVLASLSIMLHLELPNVNVLAKSDIFEQIESDAGLPLEYYAKLDDFSPMLGVLASGGLFSQRYLKLSANLLNLVDGFGLLSFVPLSIEGKNMLAQVLRATDAANGFDCFPS
jgi:GTPase SAR1 family protein